MAEIFVVDDEEEIVHLVEKILTDKGHRVESAISGREALDKLATGYRPELILLDVMMPGMDGWEVSRSIKNSEDTKHITTVMLTIRSADEDKVTSLDEGQADWHISKPFTREGLTRTVEWLLTRRIKREG